MLFAGLVARMGIERRPKRVIVQGVEGGKGYSGEQEQNCMGCLKHDLSLFNFPTEAKHLTTAPNKPGKRFRRAEEAAERYT